MLESDLDTSSLETSSCVRVLHDGFEEVFAPAVFLDLLVFLAAEEDFFVEF